MFLRRRRNLRSKIPFKKKESDDDAKILNFFKQVATIKFEKKYTYLKLKAFD